MTPAAVAIGGILDVTPTAVNWANISGGAPLDGSNADQTIAGINTPITLQIDDITGSGGGAVSFYYILNGGAPVLITSTLAVSSGDTLHFRMTASNAGANYTWAIKNNSDGGATLDTFTCTSS